MMVILASSCPYFSPSLTNSFQATFKIDLPNVEYTLICEYKREKFYITIAIIFKIFNNYKVNFFNSSICIWKVCKIFHIQVMFNFLTMSLEELRKFGNI